MRARGPPGGRRHPPLLPHRAPATTTRRRPRLYEDLGLLIVDPDLGADLTDLFNFLTGYSRQTDYRKLLVAPLSLRDRMIELIERETRPAGRRPHRR